MTADLTREVIKLGRWRAAELYYREVDKLLFELSMAHCSEELQRAVDAMPEDVQSTYARQYEYLNMSLDLKLSTLTFHMATFRKTKCTVAIWPSCASALKSPIRISRFVFEYYQ